MISTVIQKVLPDGTITELTLSSNGIMELTISRDYPDDPFVVKAIEPHSKNERDLEQAFLDLKKYLLIHQIEVVIPELRYSE